MKKETEGLILDILDQHNTLTLATIRPDGWPQATTVAYVNEGLALYVMTYSRAQKVNNIKREPRVSLTIDHDEPDWNKIKGLSMAAHADFVTGTREIAYVSEMMFKKFSQLADWPKPDPADLALLELKPKIISVLNYEVEFGHTELVEL